MVHGMDRSEVHTALGGTQLGMSLPLFGFGALLVSFGGAVAGLEDSPSILPVAALSLLASALLAMAGALLLWGHHLEPEPRIVARPSPATRSSPPNRAARRTPSRTPSRTPGRVPARPSPPRRVPSVIVDLELPARAKGKPRVLKERRA
jgi:hypothetical protein